MLKVALAGLLLASGADAFAPLAAPAMGVRARATARVAPQNFGPRMLLGGETATRSTMKMLPAAPVMQRMPALNMASTATDGKKAPIDFQLIAYFFLWYLGNYFYNITNKLALKAAGGASGFPMTISTLQLGVGVVYALFLWFAPDARKFPKVTLDDWKKMVPVAFCAAGAHSFSVFALSAGAVSFGQIVKAAEPAFAAVLGVSLYNKKVSKGKWLCLIPIIGGVVLASDRLENIGNQFAITTILAFIISVPIMLLKEGSRWGEFTGLWATNPVVSFNLLASGLWFYGYNEVATMTIKKTNAVTQSVANTAKRVIVIVGVAIVLGESLDPMKLIGCSIGIGGVFLYSIIDNLFPPAKKA
ncbi:triose-phosphate transporter family-domain-containing protein [Baffinella frigidus]|nr:triose-phosphate transporter family-domain-containing protein [Cryptophyta sp. CCMP2293]